MSRVTAYSTLYPFMVPELPGCDTPIILQALQKAGRTFAIRSEAWREDLFPIAIVDYQRDYLVPSPVTGARLHRIIWAKINGNCQPSETYEPYREDTIRFRSEYIPHDLDDSLLICGTAGTAVIDDWKAITAGSVTVTIDSGSYLLSGLNFSGCADMDAVALKIQTAIRAALSGNTGFCQWSGTAFGIWTESGTVSYLTAGTAGTDISGSGFMNGLTGAGTLSPRLDLRIVFRPDIVTDVLSDWFLDRNAEAITALALSDLMGMEKKPWTNKPRAGEYRAIYNAKLNSAIVDNLNDYGSKSYKSRA